MPSQIPYSGQAFHTHWFLRQFWTRHTYCSRESMTAPGFAERFLFGEQKGKEKKKNNTTHIIMLSRKGREQPLLRSKLYIIDFFTKHREHPCWNLPQHTLLSSNKSICAVSVSLVKLNQQSVKEKQAARRGECQIRKSNPPPPTIKTFWTIFYHSERFQPGSTTLDISNPSIMQNFSILS